MNAHLTQYLTFQGRPTHLTHVSKEGFNTAVYASREEEKVSLSGADSRTRVTSDWDVPTGRLAIIATELKLKVKDIDGTPDLKVQASKGEEGETLLSISNGGTSGVTVNLGQLKDVPDDYLQEGFFTPGSGAAAVELYMYRNSETDEVLPVGGVHIDGRHVPFTPNKPLHISEETRSIVKDMIKAQNLDWL